MDMMEIRRRILMLPHLRTIGGLPVLVDNTYFLSGTKPIDTSIGTGPDFFITGWFDTESSGSKSYDLSASNCDEWIYIRWFSDLGTTPVDYWGYNKWSGRTVSTPGRFIAASIYKPFAADYYIYDNTNQRYVFKGKNVR